MCRQQGRLFHDSRGCPKHFDPTLTNLVMAQNGCCVSKTCCPKNLSLSPKSFLASQRAMWSAGFGVRRAASACSSKNLQLLNSLRKTLDPQKKSSCQDLSYCWWKKSCTTCYLWNPKIEYSPYQLVSRIPSTNSMLKHFNTSILTFLQRCWGLVPIHAWSPSLYCTEGHG